MFERILELFFHAKTGALAGLILIGTTGALVTATVSSSNNVTTVTLTQASASPSANTRVQTSPTASPTASPTQNAALVAAAPKANTTSTNCDDNKKNPDVVAAVKTVDAAFSQFHNDLMHMRSDKSSDKSSDAAKTIIETADKQLKDIRQNAVKAIHAASKTTATNTTCAKEADDKDATEQDVDDKDTSDKNDNEDETDTKDESTKSSEKSSQANFVIALFNNLFGKHDTTVSSTTNTTLNTTASGDVKKLADDAVAAMKVVFDTAKTQVATANATAATPKPAKSTHSSTDAKSKSHHHADDEGGND